MTKFVTSMILGAALLAGAAAGAYAADPQPANQLAQSAPGQGYSTPGFGPKASGGANTSSDHFVKPPGYDQNPNNFPYSRPGVLKAN
jgi:hypothetical protein